MPLFVAIQRETTSCQGNIPAGMKVIVVGVLALVGHQRLLTNSQGSGCSFSDTPDLSCYESSGASLLLSQ